MKKFQFSLEAVLRYKQQALDARLGELSAVQAMVRRQEDILEQARQRYDQQNREFSEKKRTGIVVSEALMYENGLRSLELEVQREADALAKLRRQEEEKRGQVIEAKKDTKSLEKLKDKKLDGYHETIRKSEELLVEEFVSTAMTMAAQA